MNKNAKAAKRFWGSIPKASDIKIIHSDGSVTYQKVKGKKSAADAIRGTDK